MSHEAVFYRVNTDPKALNKSLGGTLTTQQVNFKEGYDKLDPVIEIRYDPGLSAIYTQFDQVNYVRIETSASNEDFKYRYYFVTKVSIDRTGLFRMQLHLDVLMTWQKFIKLLTVTLERSETIFNGYLPDSEYTALGYRAIVAAKFPQGLTQDSYILMTTG